jgi:hypothetical protein
MAPRTLSRFFKLLTADPGGDVFNPWRQRDRLTDAAGNGPKVRRERLAAHLSAAPARILIGEAAGYQGCHVSGVPFTSERLVMAGVIPRLSSQGRRLSRRHRPWSEPSATTVWQTLLALGVAADTVLWNAFPWHPHRPGRLQSNRTPTREERARGLLVLEALLAAFPGIPVYAVGRHAEAALRETGRDVVALRHPSMGGATAFRRGLEAAVVRNPRSKCG